ncbi:hypothetical protein ABGB19_24340 [Mycobacterium sp. B14F4]|uniref:TlpA family protein disulfide reductase n=1 Tax=Mycobacterium sp. B14F4 TaxID=3153565 RepID=UPI00325DE893
MANELTGDFEAVLQVSGSVVNRLMATLHQNAGDSQGLPSHPHTTSLHLVAGDSDDGVLGWVHAQLGVPRVELLDGATDRFDLIVDVRAHCDTDADSAYLPQAIHGTVRATYKIEPIDPRCAGWAKAADDYLWARALRDTVRFSGTVSGVDDPDVRSRIDRLVADLLERRFEMAPHKVYKRFRPGQMRSLRSNAGEAVALPVSLAGATPVGQISSMDTIFLDGHDVAVALSTDALKKKLKPILDALYHPVEVTVPVVMTALWWQVTKTLRFTVKATKIDAAWEGNNDPFGSITLTAFGDITDEDGSVVVTFSLKHRTTVSFTKHVNDGLHHLDDVAEGKLVDVFEFLPSYHVAVTISDLPSPVGLLAPDTKQQIEARFASTVAGYLQELNNVWVDLTPFRETLVEQLRTLDGAADVSMRSARFRADAVVLRGRVTLSPRKPPVIDFAKSAGGQSFTAFHSWAPGGWIERFVWSWRNDGGSQESATVHQRYTLSRPKATVSKWGLTTPGEGGNPLPGLDRPGSLCLEIHGFQIDSVTGRRVVFNTRHCTRYGHPLSVAGKLLQTVRSGTDTTAVMNVGTTEVDPAAANTVVVYARGRFDRETADTLAAGLDATSRDDAGLTVLLLVGEDALQADSAAQAEMLAQRIGAAVELVDDVDRSWTRRLAIPPDATSWRLITPNGAFTWSHDGEISAEELGRVFDDHLRPSPPPTYRRLGTGITVGAKAPPIVIQRRRGRPCPPMRLPQASEGLMFVMQRTHTSEQQLAAAADAWRAFPAEAPGLVVVLDGDDEEAEELSQRHPEMTIVADADDAIADLFGVRIWPTFLAIDENGTVREIRQGAFDFGESVERRPAELSGEGDAS